MSITRYSTHSFSRTLRAAVIFPSELRLSETADLACPSPHPPRQASRLSPLPEITRRRLVPLPAFLMQPHPPPFAFWPSTFSLHRHTLAQPGNNGVMLSLLSAAPARATAMGRSDISGLLSDK